MTLFSDLFFVSYNNLFIIVALIRFSKDNDNLVGV